MTWRRPVTHVDNVHKCCSLSTDVSVLTHRKETCRVLLHVSAAWNWRQRHNSDRCAAVFVISFVSTVLLSLRHVADIVSWLLHVLTHAGVRPTLRYKTVKILIIIFWVITLRGLEGGYKRFGGTIESIFRWSKSYEERGVTYATKWFYHSNVLT
jgi:hypothetical protein